MKSIVSRIPLAALPLACILAIPAASAQYVPPTAEEVHAPIFSMAGPKLELRDDGLVYKQGSKKPYTGTINKDKNNDVRYVDGVLEMRERRQKMIFIDGHQINRRIRYGSNDIPTSDQIYFHDMSFMARLKGWNNFPPGANIPDTDTLQIKKSGLVSAHWYENGQMHSSLRYVRGKCCLGTGWHENGQKAWEQKYDDGIASSAISIWDEDGNDVLESENPVVPSQLIQLEDNIAYLGYSLAPYSGRVLQSIDPLRKRYRRIEYSLADGKKHGTQTEWRADGEVHAQICFAFDGLLISRSPCKDTDLTDESLVDRATQKDRRRSGIFMSISNVINVRHINSDRQDQYRLFPGRNKQAFASLGLHPFDLVIDIDGVPLPDLRSDVLSDPEIAKTQFRLVESQDQVTITVERDGAPIELTFDSSSLK